MGFNLLLVTVILAMLWFVIYWLVGGVIFAVVAFSRLIHLKKAQFSCIFVVLSGLAAYGAAWMAVVSATGNHRACFAKIVGIYDALPAMFACATRETVFSGLLWFVFLMTLGIGLMFISQSADHGRPNVRR